MTGKLKIQSLLKNIGYVRLDSPERKADIKGLKEKKVYQDVNIHFRNLHEHTMTLKDKKEYILEVNSISVEADSLLMEGAVWAGLEDVYDEESDTCRQSHEFEFRFYPNLTSKQG